MRKINYNADVKKHLIAVSNDMRRDILKMCYECGRQNGHLGGCMSIVEILAAIYCNYSNLVQANAGDIFWNERDRIILSKGHSSLALYAAMKHAGIVSQQMIDGDVRGDETVLFRHCKRNTDYAIEYSSGSLGLGLGFGIGILEGLKRKNINSNVFVILGDGECDEGSVWESALYAGFHHLNNLVVVIDKNNLQLDGFTKDVLSLDNLEEKWRSFGFDTITIDGHDFDDINKAFSLKHPEKPLAIIANTVKGKDVPFAENNKDWHGNYLDDVFYNLAIESLNKLGDADEVRQQAEQLFKHKNHKQKIEENVVFENINLDKDLWNSFSSKNSVGEVVYELSKNNKDVILTFSDCGQRINANKLIEKNSLNAIELGICEQNQIMVSAGLASEGFKVIAASYASFITGRTYDQLRLCLGYMNLPITIIGLNSGFDSSDLGSTHIMLSDIALMKSIGNVEVYFPRNSFDTANMICESINSNMPSYIRLTGSSEILAPVFEDCDINKPYWFGSKNDKNICLVCEGAVSYETLKACQILKQKDIDVSVCVIFKLSQIDKDLVKVLANKTRVIVIEEHNEFGGIKTELLNEMTNGNMLFKIESISANNNFINADLPENLRKNDLLDVQSIVNFVTK